MKKNVELCTFFFNANSETSELLKKWQERERQRRNNVKNWQILWKLVVSKPKNHYLNHQ